MAKSNNNVVSLRPANGIDGNGTYNGGNEPPGGDDMQARVAKLETHAEYIRRDLDEVMTDVKTIKSRLAYFAGGAAVVTGLLLWLASNRYEALVEILTK